MTVEFLIFPDYAGGDPDEDTLIIPLSSAPNIPSSKIVSPDYDADEILIPTIEEE